MKKIKNRKAGFTLAEVLITTVIIGIIAAITIQAVINNTNKQEYVSSLQKAYSVLSQVTNQIISENGSPKGDEGWADTTEHIYELYKKYLNNAKDCSNDKGCFNDGKYKYLNGNIADNAWNFNSRTDFKKLVLADGMQIGFDGGTIGDIWVDINGTKRPNQLGRDLFGFTLTENGLQPRKCSSTCRNKNNQGWNCACTVLREGTMNY